MYGDQKKAWFDSLKLGKADKNINNKLKDIAVLVEVSRLSAFYWLSRFTSYL